MDFIGLFSDIAEKMQSDFRAAQKAITHSGLKGTANEETLKRFLRQYLPQVLDISGGQLIDAGGNRSRQLDVIVSDANKTPILFESSDVRVIPIECAYAVIEVKAYLDKAELEKAYHNMKSVKSLEKQAFFYKQGPIVSKKSLYGSEWGIWPMQHFVFAFDSPGLDSVKSNLDGLQGNDPVHRRIDMICVLDKGVVINSTRNGNISALPEPGSKTIGYETKNALLLFYILSSVILNQADMDPFNIHPYIRDLRF